MSHFSFEIVIFCFMFWCLKFVPVEYLFSIPIATSTWEISICEFFMLICWYGSTCVLDLWLRCCEGQTFCVWQSYVGPNSCLRNVMIEQTDEWLNGRKKDESNEKMTGWHGRTHEWIAWKARKGKETHWDTDHMLCLRFRKAMLSAK